jgi:hypothetical protein
LIIKEMEIITKMGRIQTPQEKEESIKIDNLTNQKLVSHT